jgi:hypothetical protein
MSRALSFLWPPGNLCRAFLRAIGLEILITNFGRREETKVILRDNIFYALSRCAVHLLPMTVLAGLIWINYSNLYIGPTFVMDPEMDTIFLAGIQLAAKIQELLCVASLTTIVLQALRTELLGEGIPFGLLGSGIWYSSLGSFWSPEIQGALRWGCTGYRRARFILLLALAGGTAVVIGPASAVLMLPRSQTTPAGGTSFYLDGTSAQYWPSTVTASSEPVVCALANATSYAICPSGGYKSLKRNLDTINYATFCQQTGQQTGQRFEPECQAKGAEGNRMWNNFLIQSTQNIVPAVLNSFQTAFYGRTAALQPHAATTIKMQQIVRQWNSAAVASKRRSLRQFQWTYDLETLGSTTSPWVRVKCTDAQNLSASATEAQFPYMYRVDESYFDSVHHNSTAFSGDSRYSTISGLDRTPIPRLRTQWVSLPRDKFGHVYSNQTTSGLLIELPWNDGSRVALGCSVAAAWHESVLRSVRSTSYGAWSIALSSYDYGHNGDSPDSLQTNRPVELDGSWLRLLSAPSLGTENTTTDRSIIEDLLINSGIDGVIRDYRNRPQMMWSGSTLSCEVGRMTAGLTDTELWNDSSCGKGEKRLFIEMVLASVVVDGLSRYGSHLAYEMRPDIRDWKLRSSYTYNSSRLLSDPMESTDPPTESPSVWLEIFVNGFAYYPSSRSDSLALAVVCLYILIAGSHVIATLFLPQYRITSDKWETLTELLALCQNSPPPTDGQLKNTSAGIERQRTYATMVKVRALEVKESENEMNPNAEGMYGGKVVLVVGGANPQATRSDDDAPELRDSVLSGSCWDGTSEFELLETDGRMSVSSMSSQNDLQQDSGTERAFKKVKPGFSYS